MDLSAATRAAAFKIAAKLAKSGALPPEKEVVGVAIDDEAGIRVVVSITRYQGPARLHLNDLGKQVLGEPVAKPEARPQIHLTDLQKCVLEACEPRGGKPMDMKKLARISGYCYNSWFRQSVAFMVTAGVLIHVPKGFTKA